MSASPRFSVLIPAFDAAATLGAALESVRRQREASLECVVVDDGSRDDTSAIARRFAERDARFRVLSQPNRGIVAALELGRASCRGRYVARMDADDLMHRRRLELQGALLDGAPRLAAVGCHVRLFPRAALRDGLRAYEAWLNGIRSPEDVAREAFVECPLAHPTLTLRREVLDTFGYRDMGWPEDYDLVLRLLAAGHHLGVLPRRLLGWRDGPSRLSRTSGVYSQERFVACKAAFLAETFLANAADYVLWGYGGTGRALARALLGRDRRPSHIVELHPGRLGNCIQGAPVIPPSALEALRPPRIVVSVAGAKARREIRGALGGMGFVEGSGYVMAA